MKNKLIWAVLIVLALTRCEKEPALQEAEDVNLGAIDFPELRIARVSDTDSLFAAKKQLGMLIATTFGNTLLDTHSRMTSETYGFSIDTSYVQVITTDIYESYTFMAEDGDGAVLKNYILTMFPDGNYKQLLVTYPKVLEDGDYVYDIDQATASVINDDSLLFRSQCSDPNAEIWEWEELLCISYNCGLDGNHPPGVACNDGVIRSRIECTGGAWAVTGCDTYIDGTPDGAGTTTGGTNGGGADPDNDNPPAEPDLPDPIPAVPFNTHQEQIINCLGHADVNSGNTFDPNLVYALNRVESEIIANYLNDNQCSQEAQGFALPAIDAIVEGLNSDVEIILYVIENEQNYRDDMS